MHAYANTLARTFKCTETSLCSNLKKIKVSRRLDLGVDVVLVEGGPEKFVMGRGPSSVGIVSSNQRSVLTGCSIVSLTFHQ